MSRDYKSRKSSTTNKGGGSLIAGLFIGYTLGLVSAIGVWMYISHAPSPFLSEEEPISTQKQPQTEKSSNEKIAAAEDEPKFDFYKILPGIEEPVTDKELKQTFQQQISPHTDDLINNKARENYFLQAGAFRKTDEAENLKARLALLGVVATVQSVDLSEKGVWHRVRIGPFEKMDDINQVRASLQQNDIEASFIKVRSSAN